jgi:hypothetical protein
VFDAILTLAKKRRHRDKWFAHANWVSPFAVFCGTQSRFLLWLKDEGTCFSQFSSNTCHTSKLIQFCFHCRIKQVLDADETNQASVICMQSVLSKHAQPSARNSCCRAQREAHHIPGADENSPFLLQRDADS